MRPQRPKKGFLNKKGISERRAALDNTHPKASSAKDCSLLWNVSKIKSFKKSNSRSLTFPEGHTWSALAHLSSPSTFLQFVLESQLFDAMLGCSLQIN